MIEIRFHGRGGQQMNLWAEALARAAMDDGRYSQTWVAFGLDQTGVPNTAVTRIDDAPIRLRASNAAAPNFVVLLDPTVPGSIAAGLQPDGVAIVPAGKAASGGGARVIEAPTAGLKPNEMRAVLLGAVAALSGACSEAALVKAIEAVGLGDLGEYVSLGTGCQ
jgi:2-oxoacid:acceptor oxidoreductase gamma subunit (pyruvate/2-ketoisovalerate family)